MVLIALHTQEKRIQLNENLSGMNFQNLDWRFKIFEGKNHNNSDLVALFHGLGDFIGRGE